MNAEQMFKELGYEKREESEGVLLYISDFENSILFENKRVTITDLYCYGTITININCLLENAIHKQCKELGWLEEEKPEIKRETNIEHYYEYLSEVGLGGFALVNGRCTKCSDTSCSECDFNGDCIEGKFRWLKQPYKESTYKLTQYEYDLLNAYKNSGMRQCISNYGTLLEMYGKGHFKGIDTSTPIHEILNNCKVV